MGNAPVPILARHVQGLPYLREGPGEVRPFAKLGLPQYGAMIDTPMAHPFLMVYSERPGRAGASDPIYRRAARPYRVDMKETRHLEFSDMVFWGGPLRERPVLGTLAAARAAELTALIVRQYFDQELLGRRSALLSGGGVPPELTVRTIPPIR